MEEMLEIRASKILLSIGISPNLNGFRYLREAIVMATLSPEMLGQLTKMLYPYVAKKYSTSGINVERDMRNAINVAAAKGRMKRLDETIGIKCLCGKRPTSGELIALISYKLFAEREIKFQQNM